MQSERKVELCSFPQDLVAQAMRESELKDKIWTLIAGGDKTNTITAREMENVSKNLGMNLCQSEIASALFWGKYGGEREFKKIERRWLDLQTGICDPPADHNQESQADDSVLKDVELSYADFCRIFEKNEGSQKQRMAKKINVGKLR